LLPDTQVHSTLDTGGGGGFDDALLLAQEESNIKNEKTNISDFNPLFMRPLLKKLIPGLFFFPTLLSPSYYQKRPLSSILNAHLYFFA
jgi:hypothetical protein